MSTATLDPETLDAIPQERAIQGLDAHEPPSPRPGFLDDDGIMGPIFTNPFSYD